MFIELLLIIESLNSQLTDHNKRKKYKKIKKSTIEFIYLLQTLKVKSKVKEILKWAHPNCQDTI